MRASRRFLTTILLLLPVGCDTTSPASVWQEAPLLYRTAVPPEAALVPDYPPRVSLYAVMEAEGVRVLPPLSEALGWAFKQAGLPLPDATGVLSAEVFKRLPELAQLAAGARGRARFNASGARRYGFRQMTPDGGFDLTPARLYETGRPLDFALKGGDGRDFLLLTLQGTESFDPEALPKVLARAARFYDDVGSVPKTGTGYIALSADFRPPPKVVRVKHGIKLESTDGVHFQVPVGDGWQERPAAQLLAGFLEGSNVNIQELEKDLLLAEELAALLECLQGARLQPPFETEYIIQGGLPVTSEFLAACGIVLRRERGVTALLVRRMPEHREALVGALEGLLLKVKVARENLLHAADTAPKPDGLFKPRTVTIGTDGRFEARELAAPPRRSYAPKDPNADPEGYVYTPSIVPELERETLRLTVDEYELLRRLTERAFPQVLFPSLGNERAGEAGR